MILKVIIIVTGTAWIYYRSWVAVILLIPAGVWYYIQLLDECIKRKEQEFLVQFKELIQTFSSLLNTGYSVENAVKESLKEMQIFYSDDAAILRELEIMVRQIRVQVRWILPRSRLFRNGIQARRFDGIQGSYAQGRPRYP